MKRIKNKKWWEEFWKDDLKNFGKPNKVILKFAKDFIYNREDLKAFDLASGDGRYSVPLAKMGYMVDAIDISEACIKRIKKKASQEKVKINARQGDVVKLWDKRKKYDLILCSGCLEEIDFSEQRKIIEHIKICTKRGGVNIFRYCLEISMRGKMVRDHFVEKFYKNNKDWEIYLNKEDKKMHISPAKTEKAEKARAGILVAYKK